MKTLKLLTITTIVGLLTISTLNAKEEHDRSTVKTKHTPQHEEIKKHSKIKKYQEIKKHPKIKDDRRTSISKNKRDHRTPIVKRSHPKKHAVRFLKRGDRGRNVKALQRALKQEGFYRGRIDGFFGKGVKRAVKRFQRKHRLYADGVAGAKTLRRLHLR
ncbi:MAG: Unknown protein [uncultured Sulfurovum sp.]|uniref:Peptidoglycan binding-like domain-containing protein n=1 Tax=uncultured Sulfurovum sp. TaxID=269237 RepID=A0A6S6TU81_9BACT|nr:MAG: Unknown protein [uncultured Sulfurovum sp.]